MLVAVVHTLAIKVGDSTSEPHSLKRLLKVEHLSKGVLPADVKAFWPPRILIIE
jgi:hypothetical protein